jgi:amino acid transporter
VIVLLSLINIGSGVALNAILSLSTLALYISYIIPIILLVMKRVRKEPITFGPWHLGRWGLWINLYAIVFGIFVCIFLPFPSSVPVTATYMNYSGPVFGGLLLFALVDWFARGRHHYAGPKRQEPIEIDTPETANEAVYSVDGHAKRDM